MKNKFHKIIFFIDKIFNYIKFLLKILIGCNFAIIFFLLSFFIKIRIYRIHYFLGATQYLEIYIYEKRKGFHKKYFDVFTIDNIFLITLSKSKKFNKKFLELILSNIYNIDYKVNIFKIPLYLICNFVYDFLTYFEFKKFIVPIHNHEYLYKNNAKRIVSLNSAISINNKNINIFEQIYKNFLKKNNITNYKDLITYANRDSSYKKYLNDNKDWSYHDFRNFSPEVFIPTIKKFSKQKYLNCRVGNITEQKLVIDNPYFVDYSKSDLVSEELDIYLIYKSKFFIGSGSGLDKIASFFKKPILYVNSFNLSYMPHYVDKCIFIPNIFFDLEKKKYITFSEQINPYFKKDYITKRNLSKYATSDEFLRNKVKILYNTKEDISNGANEINLLSENKLILSEEDLKIQNQFWKIINIDKISNNFIISPSFLSKNMELLK